jgi:hypothetical protein
MEENNCYYIDSQGIRKSCDMTSLINCNNLDDYNFSNLKENNTLYIKTDVINIFSHRISEIKCKFILVSGSSDYTIPTDQFLNINEFLNILNNENLIHWYAENCIYSHPKITNLPIGIDYHTLNKYEIYWGPMNKPIEQENELINVKNTSKHFCQREVKIYSNCHFLTNTRYGYNRVEALNNISKELLYLEPNKIDRKTTWIKQLNYAFVLSPSGNGLDCHRTWEALVLGCIPIVKTSGIDSLYIDLPVLVVNQWSDVTQELLLNTIENFKNKSFNYDKLTLKYWLDSFKSN